MKYHELSMRTKKYLAYEHHMRSISQRGLHLA